MKDVEVKRDFKYYFKKFKKPLIILLILSISILVYFFLSSDKEELTADNEFGLYAKSIDVDSLYMQEDNEYLVFLYRGECLGCQEMKTELEVYQKNIHSLPLYLVDLNNVSDERMKEDFSNIDISILIHVEDGKEVYRWFGVPYNSDIPIKK